jgi:GMP synthase-like glutamine amidotransferase
MEFFLREQDISYEIRDLFLGQPIPPSLREYEALVVLGGPMNVDEEEAYPFLAREKVFIRQCMDANIPILGICLGSQLLAATLGAPVRKNHRSEIGWMEVELTESGKQSALFAGVPSPMPVFQWHGDTFQLPVGALHLAYSHDCENQAFSINNRFFGIQFHVEVTESIAAEWAKAYLPEMQGENKRQAEHLLQMEEFEKSEAIKRTAQRLFKNFFIETVMAN